MKPSCHGSVGQGAKRLDVLLNPAAVRQTDAGHDAVTVDIEAGATRMEYLHDPSSLRRRRGRRAHVWRRWSCAGCLRPWPSPRSVADFVARRQQRDDRVGQVSGRGKALLGTELGQVAKEALEQIRPG